MVKGNALLTSLILHVIFFTLLFTTMSFKTVQPPITVNLQRDPGTKKIVQASLIDKRAVDIAVKRHAVEERLKHEKILEQQRQAEQLKREAFEAQQAIQLAKVQAEQKANQELQQLLVKKQIAEQQAALKTQVKKQEQLKKQQESQQALAKQQAAVKQAALKSQHDRMLADQQALLETEVEKYRAEFAAAIEENRILSSVFANNIHCKLRIMLLPDGSVFSINILESSGNPAYDQMSASAVYKSAPFSMPQDQQLYAQLREIVLSFKNGE